MITPLPELLQKANKIAEPRRLVWADTLPILRNWAHRVPTEVRRSREISSSARPSGKLPIRIQLDDVPKSALKMTIICWASYCLLNTLICWASGKSLRLIKKLLAQGHTSSDKEDQSDVSFATPDPQHFLSGALQPDEQAHPSTIPRSWHQKSELVLLASPFPTGERAHRISSAVNLAFGMTGLRFEPWSIWPYL